MYEYYIDTVRRVTLYPDTREGSIDLFEDRHRLQCHIPEVPISIFSYMEVVSKHLLERKPGVREKVLLRHSLPHLTHLSLVMTCEIPGSTHTRLVVSR